MAEDYGLKDKVIRCKDCQRLFTFTVKEQKSYGSRDWPDPIRCPECRRAKKLVRLALEDKLPLHDERMHSAVCAKCGRKFISMLDIQKGEKEYCQECWRKIKGV